MFIGKVILQTKMSLMQIKLKQKWNIRLDIYVRNTIIK